MTRPPADHDPAQEPLWADDGPDPAHDPTRPDHGPQIGSDGPPRGPGEPITMGTGDDGGPPDAGRYRPGCPRCERTRCPVRRHDPRDDFWRECWHDHDRADAHALGDHRDCLPGDALPLPDDDPHEHYGDGDDPNACRWAARWRAAALALADRATNARPLLVVTLDPTGVRPVSAHRTYSTAGPARTRTGRRSGDTTMGAAKARAVVVCGARHLH